MQPGISHTGTSNRGCAWCQGNHPHAPNLPTVHTDTTVERWRWTICTGGVLHSAFECILSGMPGQRRVEKVESLSGPKVLQDQQAISSFHRHAGISWTCCDFGDAPEKRPGRGLAWMLPRQPARCLPNISCLNGWVPLPQVACVSLTTRLSRHI